MQDTHPDAGCPSHGLDFKRSECAACNAAYMRGYLRKRRLERPAKELWSRARQRARKMRLPFCISVDAVIVPPVCPVLGIPLVAGQRRSDGSPSLDRIIPSLGYVPGNVRVISDRANRLKGRSSLADLVARATTAPPEFQHDYRRLVTYLERETLLSSARKQSNSRALARRDWQQVALILDQVCTFGLTAHASI